LPRLRFTLKEAEAEATRLAAEFIAARPGYSSARCKGAVPDRCAPRSRSSKHPLTWLVCFVFHPPEVIMDGGELFVAVNLETGVVTIKE
jgi:hypothetical protein